MNHTFALVGNPNVGKTSLYNRLTSSAEHVGNWHGVTVDKISKAAEFKKEIDIVDLPGIYSLTTYSIEEEISRNEIIAQSSDLIIYVCEANNLSRNLYLALQLIELNVPVMIVVNMIDELNKKGKTLDVKKLENRLNVPVLCVSAKYGFDGKALLEKAIDCTENFKGNKLALDYLDRLPLKITKKIINENIINSGIKPLYACIKALEKDEFILSRLNLSTFQIKSLQNLGDCQAEIAAARYRFIDEITSDIIIEKGRKNKLSGFVADKADKILLNKYLALPIFLLIMSGIFWLTFGFVGEFLTQLLENGKDLLIEWLGGTLNKTSIPLWMSSLILYGIIDGVGGVIVFLPQIVMLFFFLALLEDSGYISRVAFMTDGIFKKIGLSGRAVFTILMGLGCSATAVLTARGLENDTMRKKTVVLTPFISCSARLPVYTAITAAYFSSGSVFIIFGLYILGAVMAALLAALFEKTFIKSGNSSFIMEMPSYRFPTKERVTQIILSNAKTFIVKVGTVVFGLNVIVWVLCNFSLSIGFVPIGNGDSIMEKLCAFIAPVFKPLGFGNWKAVTALMSGLVAKEVVISTITSLGGVQSVFPDTLSAVSFLIYTLLYVPCLATLASMRKEVGIKWTVFALILQLCVAYVCALMFRIVAMAFLNGVFFGIIALALSIAVVVLLFTVMGLVTKERRCVRCMGECKNCR